MRGHLGLIVALAVAGCAGPPAAPTAFVPPLGVPVGRDLPLDAPMSAPRPAQTAGLVGLNAHDVEGLFGRPRFVRRDGPAQIWQYGIETCTLNLFLFRDASGLRVRHFEFRHPGADLNPVAGCDAASAALVLVQTRR